MNRRVLALAICMVAAFAWTSTASAEEPRRPSLDASPARPDLLTVRVGIEEGDLVGSTNAVIQRAIDIVAANGGGTVELGPGVFDCSGTVRMRSGVKLIGSGPETILRRCKGPVSLLKVEADAEERHVTVADPTGFCEGMDLVVLWENPNSIHDSPATITFMRGNTLYLDRKLIWDYPVSDKILVANAFPLIQFSDLYVAEVENLCVDGNRAENNDIGSWNLPGILVYESRFCRVANCVVRNVASDGIMVCSNSRDITLESCEAVGNQYFGIHLGSGTWGAFVKNCTCARNGLDGLYLCWRVQAGRFENNTLRDNAEHGISIGWKDTDNVFRGNTVRDNTEHGVYFRAGSVRTAGHRNTFQNNVIEDNGNCGVYVEGVTADLLFERNVIGDTRPAGQQTQRVGIWAAEGTAGIRLVANRFGAHVTTSLQGDIEQVEDSGGRVGSR